MVKIDLGCHIDGYAAVAAHTIVVASDAAIDGPRAAVLQAAYAAAQAAVRLIRPGNTNVMVQDALKKIADHYNVRPIVGTLMHQMKRYVIDGNKCIYVREEEGTATTKPPKQELATFEANEVYGVDVAFSTGDGKPKDTAARTTVYKRVPEAKYMLKSASSKSFIAEIGRKFQYFPFTLRNCDDERTAKMGIIECKTHGLVAPYPVLSEKEGDQVAHFKFTVLVLPSGSSRITGLELPANIENALFETLPEDIKTVLAMEEGNKKKKKANKKKADDATTEATAAP
jgi:curved DNA binding protein